MALRNTAKTEAVIAKRLREGRTQGRGADYKPWLDVQQVPSLGLSERIKGWKSNRVHHLFSQLEVNYFYALERYWENRNINEIVEWLRERSLYLSSSKPMYEWF